MPDHPEEQHYLLEDGTGVYLLEDGTAYLHETQESLGLMRVRQEGAPYSFILKEDGSGDVLLEWQPHVDARAR